MSHIAVAVTAQTDDDALLESKALGHIAGNKDFDIRKIIEQNVSIAHSLFADPDSKPIYAFYSNPKSRHPFVSAEQLHSDHLGKQQAYHDKLVSIEHSQITYCDRPIVAVADYKGDYNRDTGDNTMAMHVLVNDFSREYSLLLFEKLNNDVGIIYDPANNTAIDSDDIIYQSVVNRISTSAAAQRILFEAFTHDYPEQPIRGISDLANDDWKSKMDMLRNLGSEVSE